MTRITIKGLNYTEVRFLKANTEWETVMFWKLAKERKSKECGVWQDGKKLMDFQDMQEPTDMTRK